MISHLQLPLQGDQGSVRSALAGGTQSSRPIARESQTVARALTQRLSAGLDCNLDQMRHEIVLELWLRGRNGRMDKQNFGRLLQAL